MNRPARCIMHKDAPKIAQLINRRASIFGGAGAFEVLYHNATSTPRCMDARDGPELTSLNEKRSKDQETQCDHPPWIALPRSGHLQEILAGFVSGDQQDCKALQERRADHGLPLGGRTCRMRCLLNLQPFEFL